MEIKVKKLHPDAKLPRYAQAGDAAVDLFTVEAVTIEPGEWKTIPTGLAMELPPGYVGLVWDKSGLSHKYALKSLGGVLDSGYRGELHVGLANLSQESFTFEPGQKVAQLLIQKMEQADFTLVDELSSSERGEGRYGSTGKF
jgi:dUTP pyrophosphatase